MKEEIWSSGALIFTVQLTQIHAHKTVHNNGIIAEAKCMGMGSNSDYMQVQLR